jgi:hypothetical protein
MTTLNLHPEVAARAPVDPAQEVLRLTSLIIARRAELTALQQSLRDFKTRYAETVGSRLAELDELERAIKVAEARTLGIAHEETDEQDDSERDAARPAHAVKASLRNLFWSVAKLFHPDHAADDDEARRRHAIMAEASRAYREGDVESLGALLGDEDLQLYCATPRAAQDTQLDLAARAVNLKEKLLTIEFGIKRVKQDRLYRLKLETDEASTQGRDYLADEAARLERKLAKTRNRLAHLS